MGLPELSRRTDQAQQGLAYLAPADSDDIQRDPPARYNTRAGSMSMGDSTGRVFA